VDAIKTLLAAADEQDVASGFSFRGEGGGGAAEEDESVDQGDDVGDEGGEDTQVDSTSNGPISKKDKRRQKKASKSKVTPTPVVGEDASKSNTNLVAVTRCSAVEVRSVDGFQVRHVMLWRSWG